MISIHLLTSLVSLNNIFIDEGEVGGIKGSSSGRNDFPNNYQPYAYASLNHRVRALLTLRHNENAKICTYCCYVVRLPKIEIGNKP